MQQRVVTEWEDDGKKRRTRHRKLQTMEWLMPRQRPDALSPSGAWVDAQ